MRLDNYQVPRTALKVRAGFSIKSKSLGENSSATDSAHQGIKPGVVRVSLIIRFSELEELKRLSSMARAVDDNGDKVTYSVTDRTANALGIKQGFFDGEFSAPEDDNAQCWRVSFSIKEKLSVSEKTEQRQQLTEADNSTAVPESSEVVVSVEDENGEQLSGLESVLKTIDKALA